MGTEAVMKLTESAFCSLCGERTNLIDNRGENVQVTQTLSFYACKKCLDKLNACDLIVQCPSCKTWCSRESSKEYYPCCRETVVHFTPLIKSISCSVCRSTKNNPVDYLYVVVNTLGHTIAVCHDCMAPLLEADIVRQCDMCEIWVPKGLDRDWRCPSCSCRLNKEDYDDEDDD